MSVDAARLPIRRVTRSRPTGAKGVLLVLLSAAGFGSLAVFAQLAYGDGVSVLGLLCGRFIVAATLLWLLVLAVRRPLPSKRNAALGILLGAGYSFSALSFAASLRHIGAGLADLLLFAYPAMVSVGAVVMGRERWTARRAGAVSVAGVGIAGAVGGAGAGTIDAVGVLLALAAALVYATYVLASSSLLRTTDPLALAASVATGAALVFFGYAVARGQISVRADIGGLGFVIAVALSSSVLGTVAFMAGVHALGPSRASIVSSAEPALTAAFAWVTFGAQFGPIQLLGAGLLLASVPILEVRRPNRHQSSEKRSQPWPTPDSTNVPSRTNSHRIANVPGSGSGPHAQTSQRGHHPFAPSAFRNQAHSPHGGRLGPTAARPVSGSHPPCETRRRVAEGRRADASGGSVT